MPWWTAPGAGDEARGAEAGDGDAVLADLLREALGDAFEGGFEGAVHGLAEDVVVGAGAAAGTDGGVAGDVDDGAAVAGDHVGVEAEPAEEEGCVQIDGGGADPAAGLELPQRPEVEDDGVVDEHSDRAAGVVGLLDEPFAGVVLGEVAGDGGDLAAGGADFIDGGVEGTGEGVGPLLEGARGDDDPGALGGEHRGDVLADAAAGAGDDGDFVVEDAYDGVLPVSVER